MDEAISSPQKRFLIAIGLPQCAGMALERLERADSDVERLSAFFSEKQGYERVLADRIPSEAPAPTIRRELSRWFASPSRSYDDIVVLYIAAHGGAAGKSSRHFIFTSDSDPREPAETAIETGRLAQLLFDGEGIRPQNVLVILDTCYSSAGSGQAAAMLAQFKGELQDASGSGFWVIASADPKSWAGDGAFMNAFLDVVETEACSPRGGAKFVDPVNLVAEINNWFAARSHPQIADLDVVGIRKAPIFIRNLNFTRQFDGLELADEGHWNPKARGVDEFLSAGWFFTGRHAALRKLVAWINASTSDGRARVVTGHPGSGKSALLGWLVLCAHKKSREGMQKAGVTLEPDTTPTEGSINVALHARGGELSEMRHQLATALGQSRSDLTEILSELASRPRRITILVDALDESTEPLRIQNEFLMPLSACPNVRLIAAGRRMGGRAPLAGVAEIIDLDSLTYFDLNDVALYVEARLMRAIPPTRYGTEQRYVDARRIALRVAQKAQGSFLYARILSRRIAGEPPIDTFAADWESQLPLPEELATAFELDLARFPAQERRRLIDLLIPLAYSRGKGLPQKHIWHTVASRIAGTSYVNADIRELKENAGFYLVQDTEHGEAVFRLFHAEFGDYLLQRTQEEEISRSFAEALWTLDGPADGAGRWLRRAEPYVTHYLPAHASEGGILEALLTEPDFLLHLPPEAVLPHLPMLSGGKAGSIARAYRQASLWLRDSDLPTRRAHLATAFLQEGADEMFVRLAARKLPSVWMPLWTDWVPSTPSHAIANGASTVTAVAAGRLESDRPVVLVGREDGSTEVWQLDDGKRVATWKPPGVDHVRELALIDTPAGPLMVVTWYNDRIGVLNIISNEAVVHNTKHGHITALCVAELEGRQFCITASDGLRLSIWELPTLRLVAERKRPTAAPLYCLEVVEIDGRRMLLSGGESVEEGETVERSMLRLWSLLDLEPIWIGGPEEGPILNLQLVRVAGRNLALASLDNWGPFEIWDLESRRMIFQESDTRGRGWFIELRGQLLLVSDHFTRLMVNPVSARQDAIQIEPAKDTGAQIGSLKSSAVISVHGRLVLVSAVFDHIRIWDLDELLFGNWSAQAEMGTGLPHINVLASASGPARALFAGSANGKVFDLDPGLGSVRWELEVNKDQVITSLSYFQHDRKRSLVAADLRGGIHVIDLETRQLRRPSINAGSSVLRMEVCEWQGKPLAFATVEDGRSWAVRIWDLDSGEEWAADPPRSRKWALIAGQEDKRLEALAVANLGDDIRFAFASKYGKIMVANLRDPTELRYVKAIGAKVLDRPEVRYGWLHYREWRFPHANEEYTKSLATACLSRGWRLAGGNENGHLAVWDLLSSELKAARAAAHHASIRAVSFHVIGGSEVLATGGEDGELKFWTLDLHQIMTIGLGEVIIAMAWLGEDQLAVATFRGTLMLKFDARVFAAMCEQARSASARAAV